MYQGDIAAWYPLVLSGQGDIAARYPLFLGQGKPAWELTGHHSVYAEQLIQCAPLVFYIPIILALSVTFCFWPVKLSQGTNFVFFPSSLPHLGRG